MNIERKQKAEEIINKHILWAMAATAIPIPVLDTVNLIFIQVDMLKSLSKLYEIDFNENIGKTIVSTIITSSTATGISLLFRKKKVISRISMSLISGALTYALGRIFLSNFEKGVKSIIDIDLKEAEELFDENFERGQEEL